MPVVKLFISMWLTVLITSLIVVSLARPHYYHGFNTPSIECYHLIYRYSPCNSHPSSWHAIKSAKCKLYSYRLFSSPRLTDPLQWYTHACIHIAIIDIPKLNHTLSYFVGMHDFWPFSGSLEETQQIQLKNYVTRQRRRYHYLQQHPEPTQMILAYNDHQHNKNYFSYRTCDGVILMVPHGIESWWRW